MNINQRLKEIAELNDVYRRLGFGANVVVSDEVSQLDNLYDLRMAVCYYNDFNEDNDPYGEHDFGSLMFEGHKIFWKIDYYDRYLRYFSNPADPRTRRGLTIMMAHEY